MVTTKQTQKTHLQIQSPFNGGERERFHRNFVHTRGYFKAEAIEAYVTTLWKKALFCNYWQLKDEHIRDNLFLGITDESIASWEKGISHSHQLLRSAKLQNSGQKCSHKAGHVSSCRCLIHGTLNQLENAYMKMNQNTVDTSRWGEDDAEGWICSTRTGAHTHLPGH